MWVVESPFIEVTTTKKDELILAIASIESISTIHAQKGTFFVRMNGGIVHECKLADNDFNSIRKALGLPEKK